MQTIDIIILIFLGIGTYRGFQSGLLMQLLGIIAFFLAMIGGFHLMDWGTEILESYFDGYEALLPILSFIIIFIIISVVINLVGRMLKSILDMTLLGSFDNLGGAVTGLLKWGLVISVIIWGIESFGNYPLDQFYDETVVFPVVASIAPLLFESLAITLPYLQDMTAPGDEYDQALLLNRNHHFQGISRVLLV